jgi:hypothetical protein
MCPRSWDALRFFSGSLIPGLSAKTSLRRIAEAEARGSMMNRKDTMRRENRICMAYWMNAMRLPTFISPRSIRLAPNQTMLMVVRFMMSIMSGIMRAMSLFTRIDMSVSSRFATSKRFCS